MKSLRKDTNAVAPIVLIILAAVVIIFGAVLLLPADVTEDEELEPASIILEGEEQFQEDITLIAQDWNGTNIAQASVTAYLTKHGEYADIYEAEEQLNKADLIGPYGDDSTASVTTAATASGSEGNLVFSNVVGVEGGVLYDVFITDTDTGVAGNVYGDKLVTIGVKGYEDADGNDQVKVLTNAVGATDDKTITLYKRGNIAVINPDGDAKTSYTRDTDENGSTTDQEFGFDISLTNDRSRAEGITMYIAEVDNYVNTSDITLNTITITTPEETKTMSFMEVNDLSGIDPLKRNKPTPDAGAGSGVTAYYVDETFDLQRQSSTIKDKVNVILNYDVDHSAATTDDQARLEINLVSWSLQEDSEEETQIFSFITGETETGGVWA